METTPTQPAKIQANRIYIKELSYKVPQAPGLFLSDIFKEKWEPNFSFEMHVKHQALPNSQHDVTIHATVSVKTKENVTAVSIDLQQSGIFTLAGFTEEQLPSVITNGCVTHLYPYLCRAVSDASIHAGFPPIILSPLNFEIKQKEQRNEISETQEALLN